MTKLTAYDAIQHAAAGKITVIDVREAAEVKSSGIAKGALHIPLATLVMKANPQGPDFDARLGQGKPIAVYCAVGGRAGMATQTLQRMGYEAHNIGGFGDWVSAGGPVA
ncbi:MAG: hypothetical protein A3D16_11205 [Rhodobacterales bacterium RIFCSPHIGHO2_02_FULL_62_130]|jgi:rhodanese-related sulfurtransferase|nr:MAG: hypothetical protein A3D16_11205 [Rhodobacterales bacterium RIFCSPHIGHO2_02_FULL_62_130]OHC56545.1 MAG: hypothetical protein A3E48_22130 [Rhodobacterales bacterium RIFCSPHIGHO2_12_FULL_62_75]